MNLNMLLKELKAFYYNADEAGKTIINCALLAAGTAAVGGMIPILELPAMIVSCVGAVWAMYIQICKNLNINIGDNLLKVLASAALTNIATNLIGVFALEILTFFIPGIAYISGALITFASVYLAGQMFMAMLLAFARQGKTGADMGNISAEDMRSVLDDMTPSKSDVKKAKQAFRENYHPVK